MTREECQDEAARVRRVMTKKYGYMPAKEVIEDCRNHAKGNADGLRPDPYVFIVYDWQMYLAAVELGAEGYSIAINPVETAVRGFTMRYVVEDALPRKVALSATETSR